MRLPVYNDSAKKSVELSLPWHSSGYYTHNTEGYVPRPESLVIPSRPPPAERSAEKKPFFHVPRNPDDP